MSMVYNDWLDDVDNIYDFSCVINNDNSNIKYNVDRDNTAK